MFMLERTEVFVTMRTRSLVSHGAIMRDEKGFRLIKLSYYNIEGFQV